MSIRWCALFIQYTLQGLLSLLRGKIKSLQVPKCPATCYLVSPISCYSLPCLSLPTVASLLCFKQHPLPPVLSTLFSLFHCSISPSSAQITIWYTIYFKIYFYLSISQHWISWREKFTFFFNLQLPEQYLAKQVLKHYFLDWMNESMATSGLLVAL